MALKIYCVPLSPWFYWASITEWSKRVSEIRSVSAWKIAAFFSSLRWSFMRAFGDCLKTGSEACWQVDTFSGQLTGAQPPQNNMITSV